MADPQIEDIKRFTVGILDDNDRKFIGTGIIATDDGIIVTCFHVLKKGKDVRKKVKIYFPSNYCSFNHYSIQKQDTTADFLEESSKEKYDIAFIQLSDKRRPENTKVAPFCSCPINKTPFKSFGFKKSDEFIGLDSKGIIDSVVNMRIKESINFESIQVIKLDTHEIDYGMSGAALYDTYYKKVVGMISKFNYTTSNVDRDLAIGISINEISNNSPQLKKINTQYVTDEQKSYLEELIEEYGKNFQSIDNKEDSENQNYYIENRNGIYVDNADWELTDEEIQIKYVGKIKDIKNIVNEFLKEKDEKLLIGASFGMGKTSLIKKIAHDLAKERIKDENASFQF